MNRAIFSHIYYIYTVNGIFFQNYYIIFKNKMQEKQNRHIAHTSVSDVFSIKADLFLALPLFLASMDVFGAF